jgi:hypothetical protein
MRTSNMGIWSLALIATLTACGEGKFTGNTQVARRDATSDVPPGGPGSPTSGNPNSPNSQEPGGSGPGDGSSPGATPSSNPGTTPGSSTPGNTPGSTPGGSPTGDSTDNVPGTSNPGPDWAEIIETIFRPAPFVEGPDRPIDFVAPNDGVFHIGDGAFPASTCQTQLRQTRLEGTSFFFEFDVTENDTQVNVELNDVCGVDHPTNLATLTRVGDSTVQQQRGLPLGRGSLGIVDMALGRVTLPAGKYVLRVESQPNTQIITPSTPQGDRDDILIKRVRVHANKPVIRGNVRAGN